MNTHARADQKGQIRTFAQRILFSALVVLFFKVLIEILVQYRWYFPLDFERSTFLIGRQATFNGIYRLAFYVHIIASPVALLAGLYLFVSGILGRHPNVHRLVGRAQLMLVLFAVAPSGLVMSTRAYSGAIAGIGFAVLAVLTAGTVVAAVRSARRRDFYAHRLWALRCFILLCSPLLLRVMNGAANVLLLESDWFYQMSAWFSWLAPLLTFEIFVRLRGRTTTTRVPARSIVSV